MFRSDGIRCRHGQDGNPAALVQRGPRCPGHRRGDNIGSIVSAASMMQPKFINYHVGSRDVGIGFRILPAFSGDIVNILFDADIDSVAHTKAAWSRTAECEARVFPYCLSNAQRTETLHINFDAFTSSIFPFNTEYGDFYTYYDAGQVDYVLGESVHTMERRSVSTVTLDRLLERDEFRDLPPDFLSIDTQGGEYRILQGARE